MQRLIAVSHVVILLSLVLPLVLFTAPADAAGGCPTGSSATGFVGGWASCLSNDSGEYLGRINSGGSFLEDRIATPVTALNKPSSVLAEAVPTAEGSATSAAAADVAGSAGSEAGFLLGNSPVSAVAAVGIAGYAGYEVGTQLTGLACGWGVSILCYPHDNPTVPANDDVQVTGDVGLLLNDIPATPGANPSPLPISEAGSASIQTYGEATEVPRDPMQLIIGQAARGGPFSLTIALSDKGWNVLPSGTTTGSGAQCGGASSGGWDGSSWSGPRDASGNLVYNLAGYLNGYGCPSGAGRLVVGVGAQGQYPTTWYAVYAFPGDALRPQAQSANPQRQLVDTNTCTAGDGTTSTTTASSASFTEGDGAASWPAYPQAPSCPSGTSLTTGTVVEHTLDGSAPDRTLYTITVPDAVRHWQQNYPQCGGGICQLRLVKIGPSGTNLGDCIGDAGLCTGWFEDANKTSDYQCTYGTPSSPSNVDLSECNVYAHSWDPEQVAKGQRYSDPRNGDAPGSDPTTDPGSTGLPGLDGGSCFPSGWGAFNPFEWVLKPVECALTWAFVPDSATLTSAETSLKTGYDSSTIGQWTSSLAGLGQLTGIASDGCGGMTLHIPDLGVLKTANNYSVFNTCDEPWHTISLLVRAFLSLFIGWCVVLACWRILAASFGLNVSTMRGSL